MRLHLICKHGENHLKIGDQVYETGNWVVGDAAAEEAIGGRIYLHEAQDDEAWHGGTITGWRVSPGNEARKIFQYRVDGPFRIKNREGWGREKAIIRD